MRNIEFQNKDNDLAEKINPYLRPLYDALYDMLDFEKAAVPGDITQIDLATGKKSGLIEAKKLLTRIKGIDFVTFTKEDVVKYSLVSNIIDAYEKNEN